MAAAVGIGVGLLLTVVAAVNAVNVQTTPPSGCGNHATSGYQLAVGPRRLRPQRC